MRYGPQNSRRLLYCKTCKSRFSERKGTPLFHCKLSNDKATAVLEHIAEGCGVRRTGRLCQVQRNTVSRLGRLAGEHALALHNRLVGLAPPNS